MPAPADLELTLSRWDAEHYSVDLRYRPPNDAAPLRSPGASGPVVFHLDQAPALDPAAYGEQLWRCLFADAAVSKAFADFRGQALSLRDERGRPGELRVRLYISPNTPELHAHCWEALRPPGQEDWLSASERTLFSRSLLCAEWRPVRPALDDPAGVKALVVIAGPDDVGQFRAEGRALAPVDIEGESGRAWQALTAPAAKSPGLRPENIAELSRAKRGGGPSTLNGIATALRGGYDFLYLVCHGALVRGQPVVWLEDDAGRSDYVPAAELVARLKAVPELPRLVVLASCQSAGTASSADGGALSALGPKLVEAGVPAVLAMQGNVGMSTVAEFMPTFFSELVRDGQIDRAVSAARQAVLDRQRREHRPADWWMPVLFLALPRGNLWGSGSTPAAAEDFVKWPALVADLMGGQCTAVLGAGLLDRLLGTTRQMAAHLAERYHFPLAPGDRDDLPQVARFLEVHQSKRFARTELDSHMCRLLRQRFPQETTDLPPRTPADRMLVQVGQRLQARDDRDPHAILAGLPFPVYVTTTGDSLLYETLKGADTAVVPGRKKRPRRAAFSRNRAPVKLPDARPEAGPPEPPGEERPLVYHLFGHLSDPASLVLSEDDYFEMLIKASRGGRTATQAAGGRPRPGQDGGVSQPIPEEVLSALTSCSLVFLGFRLEEWDFRVLVHYIDALEGSDMLKEFTQVAVQVDPVQGHFLDPDSARQYLKEKTCFGEGKARVSIYWGRVELFLEELRRQFLEGLRQQV